MQATIAHDKNEVARLILELREDDARSSSAPWTVTDGSTHVISRADSEDHGCTVAAMSIGHSVPAHNAEANAAAIVRLRNNARSAAGQLEAALLEIDRLASDLARAELERDACERCRVSEADEIDALESERDTYVARERARATAAGRVDVDAYWCAACGDRLAECPEEWQHEMPCGGLVQLGRAAPPSAEDLRGDEGDR